MGRAYSANPGRQIFVRRLFFQCLGPKRSLDFPGEHISPPLLRAVGVLYMPVIWDPLWHDCMPKISRDSNRDEAARTPGHWLTGPCWSIRTIGWNTGHPERGGGRSSTRLA